MPPLVKIFITILFLPTLTLTNSLAKEDSDINKLWIDCRLSGVVPFDVFNTAILGYRKIDNIRKKGILTIIDFSKPSTEKRFYVIDLENKRLIYRCLVAHGKNSGDIYAKDFSNKLESLKSSLGFYLTGETYMGDHGYSLRLVGLEKGINDNARVREIVIHGAEYVSEDFIRKYGRPGRSWGCPALPPELSKEIIDKISNGSCLFIYGDDNFYRENSVFLNRK
jgi:L,D-transpeptidase catalytic domain